MNSAEASAEVRRFVPTRHNTSPGVLKGKCFFLFHIFTLLKPDSLSLPNPSRLLCAATLPLSYSSLTLPEAPGRRSTTAVRRPFLQSPPLPRIEGPPSQPKLSLSDANPAQLRPNSSRVFFPSLLTTLHTCLNNLV